MKRPKPIGFVWRQSVRDPESQLTRTARAVVHALESWMNEYGACRPAVETIAQGASLSDRAVQRALAELEAHGFLVIDRSSGRRTNTYQAVLPPTANAVRGSEWEKALSTLHRVRGSENPNPANNDANPERHAPNPEQGSPKAFKALKEASDDASLERRVALNCKTCGGTQIDPDGWCLALDCGGDAR